MVVLAQTLILLQIKYISCVLVFLWQILELRECWSVPTILQSMCFSIDSSLQLLLMHMQSQDNGEPLTTM